MAWTGIRRLQYWYMKYIYPMKQLTCVLTVGISSMDRNDRISPERGRMVGVGQ